MLKDEILENLKELEGEEFDENNIICCFTTKDLYVFVENSYYKSTWNGVLCDVYSAYYDEVDSENYLIYINDGVIIGVS